MILTNVTSCAVFYSLFGRSCTLHGAPGSFTEATQSILIVTEGSTSVYLLHRTHEDANAEAGSSRSHHVLEQRSAWSRREKEASGGWRMISHRLRSEDTV